MKSLENIKLNWSAEYVKNSLINIGNLEKDKLSVFGDNEDYSDLIIKYGRDKFIFFYADEFFGLYSSKKNNGIVFSLSRIIGYPPFIEYSLNFFDEEILVNEWSQDVKKRYSELKNISDAKNLTKLTN